MATRLGDPPSCCSRLASDYYNGSPGAATLLLLLGGPSAHVNFAHFVNVNFVNVTLKERKKERKKE